MKKIIIFIAVIAILGVGVYFFVQKPSDDTGAGAENTEKIDNNAQNTAESAVQKQDSSQAQDAETKYSKETVIGTSVEGRDIVAYNYGTGDTELLFVGGIHGGYEWNTALLAYDVMDWLDANPSVVPENVQVTVIPVLNPDGLYKTVGTTGRFAKSDVPSSVEKTIPGRFNANEVDLNRNFDCEWKSVGKWQNKDVSGGDKPFSEPESQAIKKYIETNKPNAVVVWYSSAGGVFASSCNNGILPETIAISNAYASASKYPAYKDFDFYKITGDMVNWLAGEKIPAISVLLSNHEDVELERNKAGVEALLKYYGK